MAILPANQRDQAKLVIGFVAVALAVVYWMYPYTAKEQELVEIESRVTSLETANQRAAKQAASDSIETVRNQAAENRSVLTVMRRLVPTGNEVPALLEEISTAARKAGLDVGGVVPEAVIPGDRFDTYRYTVTIIGGYHQFGEFLANVGSLPRIVAPVNFSISPGSSSGYRGGQLRTSEKDALASTITLQTYVEKTAAVTGSRERAS